MPIRLFDNTKLSTYRNCNRLYFYRYVLYWQSVTPNIPAGFGICWHSAMDVVWKELSEHGTVEQVESTTIRAMQAFQSRWADLRLPENPYEPYTLDIAAEMVFTYIQRQVPFIRERYKILQIEKPFVIPIFPDRDDTYYCGRIDKVIEWNGGVWLVDHKTTARHYGGGRSKYKLDFKKEFVDSFSPNSQIEGYSVAVSLEYGSKFKGVLIDAALVHKTERHFRTLAIDRGAHQLDAWLWEAQQEIRRIDLDHQHLWDHRKALELSEGTDKFLPAFGKNTGHCSNYGGCPYQELCKTWADPVQDSRGQVPLGFEVLEWSPFTAAQMEQIKQLAGGSNA